MDNEILNLIIETLKDKKANNISTIEISKISSLCDFMILADSNNTTHVKSLVYDVEHKLKEFGKLPINVEKDESSNWIILDYGSIVVNIFHKKAREFYDLDGLWADGVKHFVETA